MAKSWPRSIEEKAEALSQAATDVRYEMQRTSRGDSSAATWQGVLATLERAEDALRAVRTTTRARLRAARRRECAHPAGRRHAWSDGSAVCNACGQTFKRPAAAAEAAATPETEKES